MRKQNIEEAQKLVLLVAELKQYCEDMEVGGLPPEAVRKASEAERLARRIMAGSRRGRVETGHIEDRQPLIVAASR